MTSDVISRDGEHKQKRRERTDAWTDHYENTPIQMYRRFHLQKQKNNNKKSDKTPIFFLVLLENIDCGYSLEPPRYPQSMFSSKTKKNNVYPCKPQFYYIKSGFKGVNII